MSLLLITPTRFSASNGKLDTDYRYVQISAGGRFNWLGPSTETIWWSGNNVYIRDRNITTGGYSGWADPKPQRFTI